MGALMLVAGVIGAVVLLGAVRPPAAGACRYLVVIALALAVPGLLGVAFVSSSLLLYARSPRCSASSSSPSLPIGMQYAAEITNPTPEGTSNGLIQLCGQVSVVFVYIMAALRTADGSFTVSLLLISGLLVVSAVVVSRLQDAPPASERTGGRASRRRRGRARAAAARPGSPRTPPGRMRRARPLR